VGQDTPYSLYTSKMLTIVKNC